MAFPAVSLALIIDTYLDSDEPMSNDHSMQSGIFTLRLPAKIRSPKLNCLMPSAAGFKLHKHSKD